MDRLNLSFRVHTFGCKVNTYDSGLIERQLGADGTFSLTPAADSRIHVLNTCAVTREATLEAARLARRLKARDPFCLVVATGCAAQIDTGDLAEQKAIDLVVANSHKSQLTEILKRHYQGVLRERVFKSNIFKKDDLEAGGGTDSLHTRSFLKIQDGCNSFCTFCVIPFARGKSRSIPVNDLVRRIVELEEREVREVVLTGVHIGDYDDQGRRLEDLIDAILSRTKIPRIRLSSLEPPELNPRLLSLFQSDRLCRHFHMSIQSAQSDVLKGMKRQYTARQVEEALESIRLQLPDAFVGMDVIAGFPTETDDQFEETWSRLCALPWTRLHVFPYSRRPGTFAERYPTLPAQVLRARSGRLLKLSSERLSQAAINQIGQVKQVLPLRSQSGTAIAISRDFWTVEMPHATSVSGEFRVLVLGTIPAGPIQAPRLSAQLCQ